LTDPRTIDKVMGNGTDSLKLEQVRFLYEHLPASLAVNLLLALILIAVQGNLIPRHQALGWLGALCAILLARTALLVAWRRAAATGSIEAYRWLQAFRVGVAATAAAWGVGGVVLFPDGNIAHQIYVTFVLAGLCAGAITTLAIDRISTVSFLLPALFPFVIYLALQDNSVYVGMSIMTTLFLLFIAASARQSERALHENFRLRIRAVEDEARLRAMLEHSPIAARITDIVTRRVLFANRSYAALLGISPKEAIGIDPSPYYADPEKYRQVIEKLARGEEVTNHLVKFMLPGEPNEPKWVLATYLRIEYQGESADIGWFYDITERKRIEEQVEHLAYHDPLTALPNRALLRDRLQQAMAFAERGRNALALMFVDLDRFKPINDTYGHDMGDLLLEAVARRICDCVRKSDSVARFGGDEFIVLLPDIETPEIALTVAGKIRRSLGQPFPIAGNTLRITCSIGIAIYPDHATSERELINFADTAMYYAKAEGRNTVRLYQKGMDSGR
jgi:diguanylate cyclase (GGDEF)-like protein/PAS domain S-box-containing protein